MTDLDCGNPDHQHATKREADDCYYDRLCYDGELGWIDPESLMASLGIGRKERGNLASYVGANVNGFVVPLDGDFTQLRLCLDDAERRANAET